MKHISKILAVLLSLVLGLAVFASCTQITGGTGTTEAPSTDTKPGTDSATEPATDDPTPTPTPSAEVEIGSADEFLAAVAKINAKTDDFDKKTLKLTADIALTGEFTPISGFVGTFDGQFHKITGLDVATDGKAVGLFETLDGATVKNLVIENAKAANAAPDSAVGLLAGSAKNATIEAVTVSGTVTAGGKAVVGGLVGTAEATKILNVSATVTLAGTGAKAGGVVGALLEKATVTAVYADVTADVRNAVCGAVVGTKVSDSAVAFALSKTGDAVGAVDGAAYLPSYVIACKTGLDNKNAMGWNSVDWDVSGEVPTLKTDADKQYAAPVVTVDGNTVSAVRGEKIAEGLSKPADVDNVATIGYLLGDDVYYEDLPVLSDLKLTKLTVAYGVLAGTHAPIDAEADGMTVGQTLVLGDKSLTRVWMEAKAIGDYKTAVVYYADEAGKVYSVSLEKCTLAGAPENAYVVTLTDLSDGNAVAFAAPADALLGAWEKDGKVLVLDGTLTENDGKNLYRVVDVKAGTTDYFFPYYTIDGDKLNVGASNVALTDFEASTSYFDGVWVSTTGEELTFADGKVNGAAFTASADADGAYLTYTDSEGKKVVIRATANGLTVKVGDGAAVGYANNRFSGVYVGITDGKLLLLRIEGDRVFVNNAEVALTGKIDFSTETPTFSLTIGEKTYVFSKNGTQLIDADGIVYAAEADAKKFDGTWVLGSKKFVIANGNLALDGETIPLTLNYKDGAYSLTGKEMTFAFAKGRLTVSGYKSAVTNDSDTRTLWTPAQANVFLGGFKGTYIAINSAAQYEWHTISLTNGVLTIDGKTYEFEIGTSTGGDMLVKFQYGTNWSGDPAVGTLTPNGDLLSLGNVGLTMGYGAVPASLQDVIGKYYQFLNGTGEETEVGEIVFDIEGALTVAGVKYEYGTYDIEVVGGKVVVRFADAEGNEQTVTFANKTAVWSGDADHTYTNYDRILPKDKTYVVVGKDSDETLEVIEGELGHDEPTYDEDGEEDGTEYIPASFPLYGFRYTVGGKTYTSTGFKWTRVASDSASMIVSFADEDGKTFVIQVAYDPASDENAITLMSNGSTASAYSSDLLKGFAGSYTNGKDSFTVDEKGAFVLNGERIGYIPTFNFETGVYSFFAFADGKTYTIDAARREIAKVEGEVYYDSRMIDYAGIKLIAFSGIGDGIFQKEYALELTPEGWKFNGELVKWWNYNEFGFETLIGGKTVRWKQSAKAVNNYAIVLYPNATLDSELGESGYAYRYFVPEILADNVGLYAAIYATGETEVFKIVAPVYSDNEYGFQFTINSTEYDESDYTFVMKDGTLYVLFADDGKTIALTPAEGGTALAINGMAADPFEYPDMTQFVTEKQQIFGCTRKIDVLEVQFVDGVATWTYNPDGESWSKKTGTSFGFGFWNGEEIAFVSAKGSGDFVLVRIGGKTWAIRQDIFNLMLNPLKLPDGKTLNFTFEVKDDALVLVGAIDDVKTDVELSDSNYFYGDNRGFIRFTYEGVVYAVALNCDENTAKMHPALVMTWDALNGCRLNSSNLTSGRASLAPVYDEATGGMRCDVRVSGATVISFEPLAEDNTVYKLTYSVGGETYVDYLKFFAGAEKDRGVMVITGAFYPILGEHTCGDETVTVTYELNESNVPKFYMTIGSTKYEATEKSGMLIVEIGNYNYVVMATNGVATATKIESVKWKYIGEHKLMGGGSSDKAVVFLENGEVKIKYLSKDTTNVKFAADGSYLAFTAEDGTDYRIYLNPATGSYNEKSTVIPATKAAFLGTHDKLTVEISYGYYSCSLTVKYDGSSVGAATIKYHSDKLMSFEIGSSVHVAEVTADGVKVTENVLNLASSDNKVLNARKGSFKTDKDNQLVIDYTVTGTFGAYTAKFAVTLDGKDATLAEDSEKGLVDITCDGVTKHYAVYGSGSSSVYVEVGEADYAKLGSETVNGYKLSVKAEVKQNKVKDYYDYDEYEWVYKYTYTLNFVYYVDDVKMTATEKEAGDVAYTKLTGGSKTFYLYISDAGKLLQLISSEDAKIADMSSKTVKVGDVTYTLKGNVTFADNVFTVGYVFGTGSDFTPVTLTAVEGVENAWSFTCNGATYYYLTAGSNAMVVTAEDYKIYGERLYGDVTLKFTWGNYSYYGIKTLVSIKKADGSYTTAVELETKTDVNGKTYNQFTVDGKTYILAKDKDGKDVLTDVTNLVTLKHASNLQTYTSAKAYDWSGKTLYSSVKGAYQIKDDGKPVFVILLGNDTVVSEFSEFEGSNGSVLKMTVDGKVRLFAIATGSYYTPDDSYYWKQYDLIEVTEAEAAFFGKTATVDGVVYTVLPKRSYSACMIYVYVGTADKAYANKETATFAADGSLTFSYGGVNYTATVTNGVLTITVVTESN